MRKFFLASVVFVFLVSCTDKPQEQVGKVIDEAFTTENVKTHVKKDFEKVFGKGETKFTKSVSDFIVSRIKYSYSDVRIDGDVATAKIKLTSVKPEAVASLVILASLADRKVKDMTLQEFVSERAAARKEKANINDLPDETYESVIEAKRVNDKWTLEPGAFDKVFLKKNKVAEH